VLNPLVVALLVALGIAMSPWRKQFVDSIVYDTVAFVGASSTPLILVQMGASMARPPEVQASGQGLRMRSALIIVFLRLVAGNVIGAGLVTACRHAGWIGDPQVALCLYLICCSPSAANLGLVSSVQQAYVKPTSILLFLMQMASVLTMTISIAVYVTILA